jgi:hypothetical protein
MDGVALITPLLSAPCSFTGLDPGFYKRMKSYLLTIKGGPRPPFFVFCRHWVAAGETKPGPLPGKGSGVQQALAAEGPQAPGPPLLILSSRPICRQC